MIQMPHRSVTRFFIPLIDVLTLLFGIFLLSPMVKKGSDAAETLQDQVKRLEREKTELTKERDQLLAEAKGGAKEVLKSTGARVLEIDPTDGHLFYRDPNKIDIRDEPAARRLIDQDRRERPEGTRDTIYIILFPREPDNPYPLVGQKERYTEWFKGVPLRYDNPNAK
jgi:hypothetical protein